MEGEQVHCGVCGEEVKSASSNQGNGESSSLLQSYLRGISCHFQEEINFGDLKGLVACDGCSAKINSIQRGKERFEGLRQEVSEVERNLHWKLTDMESVGQKVFLESKEIENLIKDRIQKKDNILNQGEIFLKKGTEKVSVVMNEAMRELKAKRTCVKTWTCGVDADEGIKAGTSSSTLSSSSVGGCGITTVPHHNNEFEAGEVFQMKTEQEEQSDKEEDDNVSTGEPVPDCVVKVEDEEIRTIRHRVIYGKRKVRKVPFEALPTTMLQIGSNQKSVEYETIDLEAEEAEASNWLSGLSAVRDSSVGCVEGTMNTIVNFKNHANLEPPMLTKTFKIGTAEDGNLVFQFHSIPFNSEFNSQNEGCNVPITTELPGENFDMPLDHKEWKTITKVLMEMSNDVNLSPLTSNSRTRSGSHLLLLGCGNKAKSSATPRKGPFLCQDCGKSYERRTSLVKHVRYYRRKEKFYCEICNKSFSLEHHVTRHMKSFHSIETSSASGAEDLHGDVILPGSPSDNNSGS